MKDLEEIQVELEADGCVVYDSKEFKRLIKEDWFTSFDGEGYLYNGSWETDISVWDKKEWNDETYPYVCWYNK